MINHPDNPDNPAPSSSDAALSLDIVSLMHGGRGLPQESRSMTTQHHLALASAGGQLPLLYLLGAGVLRELETQRGFTGASRNLSTMDPHVPIFPIGDIENSISGTPSNGNSTLEILDAALSIAQEGNAGRRTAASQEDRGTLDTADE